jgi:uncharacterized membrane-anchored protein
MNMPATTVPPGHANKIPAITLTFWLIKVLSTTVGETGADFFAGQTGWDPGWTLAALAGLLAIALSAQFRARHCVNALYWTVVVMVSVVGTQITDWLTDSWEVPLTVSTPLLAALLGAVFLIWHRVEGSLSVRVVATPRREALYWSAILCTFALGTAAGDWFSEALGFGFGWSAVVFAGLLAVTFAAWRAGAGSVGAFWTAYVLTRPLGATLGDLLMQDHAHGGLGMGPLWTSGLFLTAIVALIGGASLLASGQPRPATSH